MSEKKSSISYILPDEIGKTLVEHLKDENAIFVFPTDIASAAWSDWLVTHPEISGVSAVPLERFYAWDNFKSEKMSSSLADKKSVPSVLRKIFVRNLICQNDEAAEKGEALLGSLINPKYAKNALAFTDWLAGILPSLKRWHNKFTAAKLEADADDKDYMLLYDKYSEFLERHSLFEPAWLEPNFSADSKETFLIFFPEILEDYDDYLEIFEKAPNIKIFSLAEDKEEKPRPAINFFTNARTELRALALQIKKLADKNAGGVAWKNIAVSVPDIATWRPYIEREFKIYGIPYLMRSGEPLTQNSAGHIFSELKACVAENFSYDSVRALLLDDYVPWKNKRRNENFVRLGNECACVLGQYTEGGQQVDVWEMAIKLSGEGQTTKAENEIFLDEFYNKLRRAINSITSAKTFAAVRKSWFAFKDEFLDSEKFAQKDWKKANDILGRCLSELSVLIEIENEFLLPENKAVHKPFEFFVGEIEKKIYQPQENTDGVSVFPYKLSALAPFEQQFVVDASQKSLAVGYKTLAFLSKEKRKKLGIEDSDQVSDCFVRLYAGNGKCVFSGAQETFSGFAIPYSFFLAESKSERKARLQKILDEVTAYDNIFAEKSFYKIEEKTENSAAEPKKSLLKLQKDGFELWQKLGFAESGDKTASAVVQTSITEKMKNYNSKYDGNKNVVHISQSDMKKFFPCPRQWLLGNVLRLQEDSLAAELLGQFDNGNIMHKILEKFLKACQAQANPILPRVCEDGTFENETEIFAQVLACTKEAFADEKSDFYKKPLVLAILESQENNFAKVIVNFLRKFCQTFGGWKVRFVEEKFCGKQKPVDGEQNQGADKNWTFIGKIDCVLDEDGSDKNVAIVDFKTGTPPSAKQSIADDEGNLEDFQMPVYVTMWSVSEKNLSVKDDAHKTPAAAVFWKITGDKGVFVLKEDSKRGNAVSAEGYTQTLQVVHKMADEFCEAVETGALSPDSDKVKIYTDCRGCKFNAVCRTTYSVAQSVLA